KCMKVFSATTRQSRVKSKCDFPFRTGSGLLGQQKHDRSMNKPRAWPATFSWRIERPGWRDRRLHETNGKKSYEMFSVSLTYPMIRKLINRGFNPRFRRSSM